MEKSLTVRFLHSLLFFLPMKLSYSDEQKDHFIYNGFHDDNMSLNGIALIHPDGLLQLTNVSYQQIGRAFYRYPIEFGNSSDGWSFKLNGQAEEIDISRLPPIPGRRESGVNRSLQIGLSLAAVVLSLMVISGSIYVMRRKKYEEIREDWEQEYGPHRFSFKDLSIATKDFSDKKLLGVGGFGRVYQGVLRASDVQVAVKRVSHDSKQGMKEFVAEITSIGRLRHRNLVQLLGYCRRKGELLLVYDFMPNGSLDKFLFTDENPALDWHRRFRILQGVAYGLLYLHEEWEQVVVHRDVKASNVLLDADLNGRLGDFGLARLYDHGTNPQTTHVVGTFGYLAPEMTRTGKATTHTDVFAFGALMLEVACGRRPIEPRASTEKVILVEWVWDCWRRGAIIEAADPKLGNDYVVDELELVLKLGLLCSHLVPAVRPSMRHVTQFLDGNLHLPDLPSDGLDPSVLDVEQGPNEGFDELCMSYPSSLEGGLLNSSSVTESVLSGGR
ncbi:probable L-type lectin-domain containing receptor kinase I.5 isoform X2 [Magnolia sinica]|uniref:probable L-type lectin-domain containing receptor kinase I.5 isoform X2 n=1 Tax=Magnolia sinica TaxID=86752 RepID=UPI00265A04C6|nr:probable L-type lectin-domain containing receptor kinase I.5 isoform X2 [Magnolia sinica]